MATVTTSTQIDTINILGQASGAQPTDFFLLQRGITSFKLPMSSLIIPVDQIAPISNLRVIGNVSGSNAIPEAVVIDTDLSIAVSDHESIPTSKSVKQYIETTVTAEVMHYVDSRSIDTAWNVSTLSAANIILSAETLAGAGKVGDTVLLTYTNKYTVWAGNGTSYRSRKAYAIYRIDTAWTATSDAVWVLESNVWV
tara:strand:+ start:569 stop:1159 length:591 start_codon:yes stop_codon:yes gene_type:complete